MKIDLLKDEGILAASEFPERVAPKIQSEAGIDVPEKTTRHAGPAKSQIVNPSAAYLPANSSQSPRGLVITLATLAVIIILGYLYKQGTLNRLVESLTPAPVDTIDTIGVTPMRLFTLDSAQAQKMQDSLTVVLADSVLPEAIFEQYLPVPGKLNRQAAGPALVAEANSDLMSKTGADHAQITSSNAKRFGTSETSANTVVSKTSGKPAPPESETAKPAYTKQYSPTDWRLITNRVLFHLAADLISLLNTSSGQTQLYMDHDHLKFESDDTNPRLEAAVMDIARTITRGNLQHGVRNKRLFLGGDLKYALQRQMDYIPKPGDIYHVLDGLVGEYNVNLTQIIVDLKKGIRNNPAKLMFKGNLKAIRRILDNWAHLSSNFVLEDLTIQQNLGQYELIVNIKLIEYE